MQIFPPPPLSSSPRGVFAKIAREFQILCFGLSLQWNGGIFDDISKDTISKINYLALLRNLTKLG